MSNLDKALEWADTVSAGNATDSAHAAAKIIQSLPDHWLDVKKVNEEADLMDRGAENAMKPGHNDFSRGYAEAMQDCAENLRNLITPPLPTLAELIEQGNDPAKYQWMQCRIEDTSLMGVITGYAEVGEFEYCTSVTFRDESDDWFDPSLVKPLTGEPKLQWPGSKATISNKEKVTADQQPNSSETPKSSIKPEDVPHNEPWLIEVDGQKAIGTRYKGEAQAPWAVAALNGLFVGDYQDYEITLIHKLVPEPPALPEGMRLADHEKYGRTVVSQRADKDGEHKAFHSDPGNTTGVGWDYVHEGSFTFLDSNQ